MRSSGGGEQDQGCDGDGGREEVEGCAEGDGVGGFGWVGVEGEG